MIIIARGNFAKEEITKKIIECFGQDRVILYDKKLYITTTEDGAPIQVCLTLTCPKTMVSPTGETNAAEPPKSAFSGGIDFENLGGVYDPSTFKPAEITPEEKETVMELMKRLNL